MVSVGDAGVIFKEQGGAAWTRYLCDPDSPGSFTTSTPTYTDASALFTDTNLPSKTMVQVREDPENYVLGTIQDLYVIDTSDSTVLGKASYSSGTDTISIDSAVTIPADYKI